MLLNVLSQCVPAPFFEGTWRAPGDATATGYRSLGHWIDVARRLDAAGVDALFFADIHGVYDVYQGSWEPSVRHAMQVPAIDPVLLLPALAAATSRLGLAVTYSTSYHQPYQTARVFSTLDHLTGGRVGWNIVTSDLRLARGSGLAEPIGHDERYDRADEYLDLVVRLWEDSWADDAVVRRGGDDTFTDPARVRSIAHEGRWFRMDGPHQCEPSPQRTPVLYQAGASPRGREFAARHAEVVFVTLPGFGPGREQVDDLRLRTAAAGRDPRRLKVLQGMSLVLGATEQEAATRAREYLAASSRDGLLAKWCGWSGVDLAAFPPDTPLDDLPAAQMRSVAGFVGQLAAGRTLTVRDLAEHVAVPQRPHPYARLMLHGTPERVADRMQEWIERTGIDGFTLMPCPPTRGLADLCELLVPELRRRGLVRSQPGPEATLRQRYLGLGEVRYQRAGVVSRTSSRPVPAL